MNDVGAIPVGALRVEVISSTEQGSEQGWSALPPVGHYAAFGPFDSDEDAIGWIDAVAFFQEQALRSAGGEAA